MGNSIKDCMSPAYSEILFTLKGAILYPFFDMLYISVHVTHYGGKKRATMGVGRELFALLWPFHPTVSRMKCGIDSPLPAEAKGMCKGIFNILNLRPNWLLLYQTCEPRVSSLTPITVWFTSLRWRVSAVDLLQVRHGTKQYFYQPGAV